MEEIQMKEITEKNEQISILKSDRIQLTKKLIRLVKYELISHSS